VIERVTFHNEENGFCVLRVKVRGHRDDVTVLGSLPSVNAGEWLEAEAGGSRQGARLQFKTRLMKTVPPTTVEASSGTSAAAWSKASGRSGQEAGGSFGAEVLASSRTGWRNCNPSMGSGRSASSELSRHGRKRNRYEKSCCSCTAMVSAPAGGTNFQELWRAGDRESAKQSVHAGEDIYGSASRPPIRSRRRLESLGIRLIGRVRESTCLAGSDVGRTLCAALEKLKLTREAAGNPGSNDRASLSTCSPAAPCC